MRTAAIIFARRPLPGRAKTRLMPALGAAGAATLAEALAGDALAAAAACPWAVAVLAVDDDWAPPGFESVPRVPQGPGDLGARLERVLTWAIGRYGAGIALGADTAGLDPRRITALGSALDDADVAVGPAEDGGYWGLAARCCPAGWLRGVRWSVPETRADTLFAAASAGLTTTIGPTGWDVDRPADLDRLVDLLRDPRVVAPRTRAALSARADPTHGAGRGAGR